MNDTDFQTARAKLRETTAEAFKVTMYMKGKGLKDKGVRFPGFHQRVVNYKQNEQVVKGALRLPTDIVMHESVPMKLKDGVTLYSDIFLPPRFQSLSSSYADPVPVLVAWSPYGKQQGTTLLSDFPMRAGVPRHWLSGLEKWEGPDPAFWCPHEYAIVNVDTRGAFTSEGDCLIFGHQEAEDGAEFITWISEQPWCNGKVALTGNSWLAMAQWKIGSLRPRGLAALAPWEGGIDPIGQISYAGGVPFGSFHNDVLGQFVTQGKVEDVIAYVEQHRTRDAYWDDKMAHPEWINVPTYVAASWTNPVHTPGTFKAWSLLHPDIPKWLRVHNSMEWPDYYNNQSQQDLKRFFDHYLHGKPNGWTATPPVRLSVLHMGLKDQVDTINRPETEFPLARTRYTKYFLCDDGTLSLKRPPKAGQIIYNSTSGQKRTFTYQMPRACETTGYFMAHLVMASNTGHHEMDVFVQVENLSATGWRQGTMPVQPTTAVPRAVIKLLHDWQVGLSNTGMVLNWGPNGQLRASFAPDKDNNSKLAEPNYPLRKQQPLSKGEVRSLDIPMKPYGMFWQMGEQLRLTVSGAMVNPFLIPGLEMHKTDNEGDHIIHVGGLGEQSSYLLVPHVA